MAGPFAAGRLKSQADSPRGDLVEAVPYLAERSEQAARRFRIQAEATFGRLAASPGIILENNLGIPGDDEETP